MCGICGIFRSGQNSDNERRTSEMMNEMNHRGPDDRGLWSDNKIAMGFVRLSIIDLSSTANQPMKDENGRYVITFNGEIYNYIEIREKLKEKGHTFRTSSDTEVLLNSYIEWGKNCLEMLNGMFAFAIYDRYSGKLLIARDRYGIKPLYYYHNGSILIYASEIQPILKVMPELREANEEAVFNYLVFNRTDYSNDTFFKRIKKLGHGCYAEIDDGIKFGRWYDLKDRLKNHDNTGSLLEKLESSVKLRLRSDVPVGVCLSGGLDSSAIMSILTRKFGRRDINSFSAVYGSDFKHDEKRYISEYEEEIENMYFTTPTYKTLFDDKEKFINAQGEPIPSTSPYAQYKVMELARNYVKVTLDGQGADEELAGYHYFFGNYFKELLIRFRLAALALEIISYGKLHRSNYAYKTFAYYLLPAFLKTKLRGDKAGYLGKEFFGEHSKNNKIAGDLYSSGSLNEALYKHFEMKLEHLLKWEDRNSMHHSIEARLPFLDYRVVEHCLTLPSKEIIYRGETKHTLRKEMSGILPENIRKRSDKIGFDTPEDDWFREGIFTNYIQEMLNSEGFRNLKCIDADKAILLFRLHREKKINISKDIWKWINLDMWYRNFINQYA